MTPEELRDAIQAKAVDGKVACKNLLDLAAESETPSRQMGDLCDELGLKIMGCQLGCFK